MEKGEYVQFCCPSCNKPASQCDTLDRREFSAEALTTPYFLCGECRLMFISKQLVRRAVSEWWHRAHRARQIPFNYFYHRAIKYLYGEVLSYHKGIGYRLTRFKKIYIS